MNGLKRLLSIVNTAPLRPDDKGAPNRDLWRLFSRYFLTRHWPSLAVALMMASLSAFHPYVYAWSMRFITDDIVQVQLLADQKSDAQQLDPSFPGQQHLFAFDGDGPREALVDNLEAERGRPLHEKLRLLGGLTLALVLFTALIYLGSFFKTERLIYVGQKTEFLLRQRLHDKMQMLPQTYHDRHSPGELLTHLFSDVKVIQREGLMLLMGVVVDVLTMVIGLVIVLGLDPVLALLVLLAIPAYAVCYQWFRSRLWVVNANLREREGRLNAHIANRIRHFQLVKLFMRETGEAVDFIRQAKPLLRDTLAASVLSKGFAAVCGLVTGLCINGVLWIGALRVRDGQMSLGDLMLFYAASGILIRPVASLINRVGMLHRLRAVAARVIRLLDEPITVADPYRPLPVPTAACDIEFDHVTMRYPSGDQRALDNISFSLPAGQRLCVMGKSGSGGTTLAKLLCRLYDPSEGTVRFHGTDIRRFKLADLRRLVGFVPQEPIIFSGTIDENIRYGSEEAEEDAVVGAAQDAQIHDFIQQLPNQYGTLTFERGLTLSGGQKQRVNLARALLYDPKILVLDDCTSALDAQTEARLLETFRTVLQNRTVVIVSHRLSVALECDLLMMLDGGQVVEFGPPTQLLQGDGAFSSFHRVVNRKARLAEKVAL